MDWRKRTDWRRFTALLLSLLLLPVLAVPALAQSQEEIVRVGWFESPFNRTDELDRRSGYAYEYQQKLAAYTGWTYEYVEGSWPELLRMLQEGKIDLLSDVSYTPERGEKMLFSTLPMGAEEYYLFAAAGNREISPEDLTTLNGKRVGVNRGSIQVDLYRSWAQSTGVETELVELSGTEEENFSLLNRGRIDLYVSLGGFGDAERTTPVCRIGASDFYFAVNIDHPQLLTELNAAMNRIQEEDPDFNEKLYERYLQTFNTNRYLSSEEQGWLDRHGVIRVGYQDNYLSFCARDPKTGELTGALKDYLNAASGCLEGTRLRFEPVAYPTSGAAMEAMKRGEVDCVFPANLTDYDGEVQGCFMTPPLMCTDMLAVVRTSEKEFFENKSRVTVAVNVGNPNYDMFLKDHFPDWRSLYFMDTKECLQAVADGKADCLLISNYRFNNISLLCRKLRLETLSTGVEMNYCLALNRTNPVLYSILTKVIGLVPDATVNSSLSYYFTKDAKVSILDLLSQNQVLVALVLAAVLFLVAYWVRRCIRAEKKAGEHRKLILTAERDALTGLYTRNFFSEYAEQLRQTHPDRPMDAIALDIERFRRVNAVNGRGFGDLVLRSVAEELRNFLEEHEGLASRMEADHFALCCPHLENSRVLFHRIQGRLDALSPGAELRVCMGVMPWEKELDFRLQMAQAQAACAQAHGRFREHLMIYDSKLREKAERERVLGGGLRRAADFRELELHYLPVYDLQTGTSAGNSVETLIRWRHPELGMLEPAAFVPFFERSGQIGEMDRVVWTDAAHQAALWREEYSIDVPFSVNLSPADLCDPELEDVLLRLREKNGLNPGQWRLEVTESAFCWDPDQAMDVIERLRGSGFEVALDGFGAGVASLNLLSGLKVDALKLDRSLVSGMEHREDDRRRVELILAAAGRLGIPVIAVGVETEEQRELLLQMGCTLAQGYRFSRPLTAAEFGEQVLKQQ